jgi:hypothetical protein
VAAAIALEPLDPGIDDAERRDWISRRAGVTISFDLDVDDETQQALREHLSRDGDLYRRTRDSLADPHSPDGQALAAALDYALASGSTRDLISGEWDQATG